MFKKAAVLTRPSPGLPRHAFPRGGRSEVHSAMNKAHGHELMSTPRTKPGAMCVSAHKGRAGAIEVFFNILVVEAI